MVEVEEDLDAFFSDDSVLSAVSAAENQHLQQRQSNHGAEGEGYATKRKEQWEQRGNSYYQPEQNAFANTGGYYEDKKRRTVNEAEHRSPTKFGEHETETRRPEGEYMAALRGSNSETWLKVTQERKVGHSGQGAGPGYSGNASGAVGGGGASGNCYKCGLGGHWARDCPKPAAAGGFSSQDGGQLSEPSDVPVRNCPCGAGPCIVLTASTEKNMGRRFYKCPLKRDEGQCSFFEWCDGGGGGSGSGGGGGQSVEFDRAPPPNVPPVECKCGGGPCVVLTAKTERNNGRAFYKCPLPKEQGCGFFQWCDEAGNEGSKADTSVPSKSFSSAINSASGSCYKCGLGGHWAKDCTSQNAGRFTSGTAYTPGVKKESGNFGSGQGPVAGSCYKCGQPGHWSSSCPNSGGGGAYGGPKQFSSGGSPGGSCYKCGNSGHWANKCPAASGGRK